MKQSCGTQCKFFRVTLLKWKINCVAFSWRDLIDSTKNSKVSCTIGDVLS